MAVIIESELTVNDWAPVPPKLTAVAPVKWLPLMVTVPPAELESGEKDVMLG
jgi:hypothetical protein